MSNMTMKDILYNARTGMFEARIDVRRGDVTYRYPCSVAGPITMSPSRVRSGLMRQAERMSDSGASLRSVL